jgi:hypothetical protein
LSIEARTGAGQGKAWAWLGLGAALALTLLLYLPTLGYYWAADDFNYVVKKDWPQVLNFFNLARGNGFYRPLTWLSFVADYQLWGANPALWRLTNLVINLGCVALVWLLAYRLRGPLLAALAALIFAAHPAHPGSITWVNGRADALATLMYLGCVTAFVLYMQTRRRLLYDLALVILLLAILAKEIGLTAPAMLLLADLLFFPQPGIATGRDKSPPYEVGRDKSRPYKIDLATFVWAKLRLHAPFMLLGGGYLLLRLWLNANHLLMLGYGGGLSAGVNIADNLAGYLGMLLGLPSIAEVQGATALALLGGFLIVVVALAVWAGRLAWFGLAWIFVSMAPFVNIPANDLATRYAYLPSVGLALLLAAALNKGMQRMRGAHLPLKPQTSNLKPYLAAAVAILTIGYGCLATLAHNDEWRVAGETTRGFLSQLNAAHPSVPPGSRLFIADPPLSYRRASILNTGAITAVQLAYTDRSLQVYVRGGPGYDAAAFTRSLSQPSSTPSYYFRFIGNTLREYPSASALLSP